MHHRDGCHCVNTEEYFRAEQPYNNRKSEKGYKSEEYWNIGGKYYMRISQEEDMR